MNLASSVSWFFINDVFDFEQLKIECYDIKHYE